MWRLWPLVRGNGNHCLLENNDAALRPQEIEGRLEHARRRRKDFLHLQSRARPLGLPEPVFRLDVECRQALLTHNGRQAALKVDCLPRFDNKRAAENPPTVRR